MIKCILTAPPKLGPSFLNKFNLADAYMRIWVRLGDIPLVEFLLPKSTPDEEQLVGFHLSIPMGGAFRMQSITLYRAFPNRIASLWDTWVTNSLRPLQEKS